MFAQGISESVRTDLERLLDSCTPLYKSRFESLSAQAQQVVDALAVNWDPISSGELAQKVRVNVNTISSQLNRLTQLGVVEKVPYLKSKAGFRIAERFFNIWYLMRASRRVRRRLIWLVEFLRLFYDKQNKHKESEVACRKAIEIDPKNPEAWNGLAWQLYKSGGDSVDGEKAARKAVVLEPESLNNIHTLATLLVRNHKWTEAAPLAIRFITEGSPEFHKTIWKDIIDFFREAVNQGYAIRSCELLYEAGVEERWRPLREALSTIAHGSRDYLNRLAPEIQLPASQILAEFGWEESL